MDQIAPEELSPIKEELGASTRKDVKLSCREYGKKISQQEGELKNCE